MAMSSRERVRRTLRFEHPDRAPRELWLLQGVAKYRYDEVQAVLHRYPSDFSAPDFQYFKTARERELEHDTGEYIDEWGSVWVVAEPGVTGEVKRPALADWSDLRNYRLPWEQLDFADFSQVNRSCAASDKYIRAGSTVRPFERMQFLRGPENLYLDIGYGVKELDELLDRLHEFFCRDLELWAKTDVDGVSFMDDWGTQQALLISPEQWRAIFKPLYRDYCDILHDKGKDVWFHSDGHIHAILGDLIEIGIDAINSQLFCMDIESLAAEFKGQITFWGEIDRQYVLPRGSKEEVYEAVRRVRRVLDDGSGGVIAQCEWGLRDPRENIEAVYEAWLEPIAT